MNSVLKNPGKKQKTLQKKTKKQIDNLGFMKIRFVKTSYEQVMKL